MVVLALITCGVAKLTHRASGNSSLKLQFAVLLKRKEPSFMIREDEKEKEKETGRGWLEIREMKARHLTMIRFVSQLVNHVNIEQEKAGK